MARSTGLGPAGSELIRSTIPPADGNAPDDAVGDPESRGETAEETKATPAKKGRKRSTPQGKTVPRKFVLSEEADERLWQTARKRKLTVSAVVNQLLLRHLPKWEVREAS
jgi:hypothetical protein